MPSHFGGSVSKVKTEQRHVTVRGRAFHFVSYEAAPGNPARDKPAIEAAWFLMSAGKRWFAVPHDPSQDPHELDHHLTQWLEQHIFC
jgi:hypothetical protein